MLFISQCLNHLRIVYSTVIWQAYIQVSCRPFSTTLSFCFPDSFGAGGKVVRSARVPMGGWAEEGQAAPRHHEPLPEESSEDEMPPHIHKVNAVWNADFNLHVCSATAT